MDSSAKVVTFADGRAATVRRPKGRDLEKAALVVKDASNPTVLMMGLAAAVTSIDGAPLVYEDLLDMDFADVMQLLGAIGGNSLSPALATSSSSSGTPVSA